MTASVFSLLVLLLLFVLVFNNGQYKTAHFRNRFYWAVSQMEMQKRKEKTWFVYDGRKLHWAEERAMRFDVL